MQASTNNNVKFGRFHCTVRLKDLLCMFVLESIKLLKSAFIGCLTFFSFYGSRFFSSKRMYVNIAKFMDQGNAKCKKD